MGIALKVETRYLAKQVVAFQNGDKNAYGKLYSLTKDLIYGFILPQIRNREMAEDILMDTYVTGMERLKDLRDPNAFCKWMLEIARTRLVDYTRAEKRNHGDPADEESYRIKADGFDGMGIVDPFADYNIERKTYIEQVVSQLEAEYFAVIYLKYTCGFSVSMISDVEKVPEGTVKRRLQIAREKLRPLLEGFYSFAPFFFYRRAMLSKFQMLRTQTSGRQAAGAAAGRSIAKGIFFRRAAAAGTGAAVGAVTALMVQGPVIRSLRYYDQNIPVSMQRIECNVKSRWALKDAKIEGKDWPVSEEDGIYTASIPENGSFVFVVTDALGQTVRQEFRVGNIDRAVPVYRDYEENGDAVILRFEDAVSEVISGIDWDNTVFYDAGRNVLTPQAVNRQTGQVLIPKECFPVDTQVEDFAGNYGNYRLTLKTVTLGAEGGSHAE